MPLDIKNFCITPAEDDSGDIDLRYNDWYILTITGQGFLRRVCDVPSGIGFKVNDEGKIRMLKS